MKIIIYGHSDTRPVVGFPKEEDFINYIKKGIFKDNKGRYHYSQNKLADIIILAKGGSLWLF